MEPPLLQWSVIYPLATPGVASAPGSALRSELLGLLICPESGAPLTGWDGQTPTGTLTCPLTGSEYPVRDGIACLLPPALQEALPAPDTDVSDTAQKRREMAARDAQVGAYDRMMGLKAFTSVELPLSQRFLWPEPDHLMLEGGCGTGRMTTAFARAVRGLVCVDFSLESLRVAQSKLPADLQDKVLFVQADLSQLPLVSTVFDRVGSFGVYEHIPSVETRARALSELSRVLKSRADGGRFALSAYRWGFPQSLTSEREGHHDGGIYFRRFTMPELVELASANFDVLGRTEALLYYHLIWGRRKN